MVPVSLLFLLLFFNASLFSTATGALSETEAILNFKKSLVVGEEDGLATWVGKSTPCSWTGVLCDRGLVWGLQMENLKLSGSINIDALTKLTSLRIVSFKNNNFQGPFPEFKKLTALKSLYLSNNQFEGSIRGDAFEGMGWLKKIHLAQNKFTGEIPISLTKLPKLLELRLDGNQFSGQIPELTEKLQKLNLSNNDLSGPIPESLSTLDPKVFEGNKGLCGKPSETECDSPIQLPPQPQTQPKSSPTMSLVVPALIAALSILIICGVIVLLNRNQRTSENPLSVEAGPPSSLQKKTGIQESDKRKHRKRHLPNNRSDSGATKKMGTTAGVETTKLIFFKDDREKFDLQDLLQASAEILGSGCFGASYKAVLSSGPSMVVKRYKQMNNVRKEEFQEHMKKIGRLSHNNLLSIVAYYYRKEEKLFIYDFSERGNLAVNLHGHQSLGKSSLDWPTRLKIMKGVARGLLYLHQELPILMAPHGHLKSSNIILTQNFEPLLTDYGLIPLINQEDAQEHMVAYKSPEYMQHGRITKKTDVWELGILILEILTGKYPASFLQTGNGGEGDLVSWVKMGFNGEWVSDLFDKEISKNNHSRGDILQLLRIGLTCCETDVEKRIDISEAVEKIEELKVRELDDDVLYSTYVSENDGKSSKGMSNESINL